MIKKKHKQVNITTRHDGWKVFISTLLSIISITSSQAQQTKEQVLPPKLVIGITIDQLRGDYLQYFLHSFGDKGFKRLLREGLVYQQLQFDYSNISSASSIATIYTGTNPYYHGITGDKKYDWNKLREVPILDDQNFIGNYTSETQSPNNLKSSTIADELKAASQGKSLVYAIAPNAAQAIISAGHAANAAFWIEDYNGKWATTTYYKDIPFYVEQYNLSESLPFKINNLVWQPSLHFYNAFPYRQQDEKDEYIKPFKYLFYSKDKFLQVKTSPFINKEVTSMAERFLRNENFKGKTVPGMLSLTYYAGHYQDAEHKEFSAEIQDSYYLLDKEIGLLLEHIEKYIGIKNTLLFITSTGYSETKENPSDIIDPIGMFYPNRCTALLNMYLMSVYGQGDWVLGYYQNQLFLNHKLIEDKQIHLKEIQRKAAEFTIQFSGVQDVSTWTDMLYGNWNESAVRFRNGSHKGITGDIIIELQPGWVLVDEKNISQNKTIRNNAVIAPLIFWGYQTHAQKVERIVKATEIAPTLSHVLRIRPPNAAKELPLREFIYFLNNE